MTRTVKILFCAVALLCLGVTICWFVWSRSIREFPLGADLRHALGVLDRVRLGESRCYQARGRFAPLEDLGPGGCGGLEKGLAGGADDGFTVEVHATADRYSVKVHPADTARLHSLYLDEAGDIHFGTRDWPATAHSHLLVERK
jgi:hypothetical protein